MNKNFFIALAIALPVAVFTLLTLLSKDESVSANSNPGTDINSASSAEIVQPLSMSTSTSSVDINELWGRVGVDRIGPDTPPQFKILNLNGKMEGLEDYKGKVIFLNFWATWCPPCIVEMPAMDRLYKKYKDKGLVVLAVNDYEPRERVEKFLKNKDYSFPILIDPSGKVTESYRAMALPSSFIIDREGKAIGRAFGLREWDSPDAMKLFESIL